MLLPWSLWSILPMKPPEAWKSSLCCEASKAKFAVVFLPPSCSDRMWLFPWSQEGSRDSHYLPKISHRQAPYFPLPRCGFLLPESSGDSRCNGTCWQGSCRTQQWGAGHWSPSACSSLACWNKQEYTVTAVNSLKVPQCAAGANTLLSTKSQLR